MKNSLIDIGPIDELTSLSYIPVLESTKYGSLLDIEYLDSYSDDNTLSLEESLDNIIKYNRLDPEDITFFIKEEVFYENPYLRELSYSLNEEVPVCIIPYDVYNDSFYNTLMEAINMSIEAEDDIYLDYVLQEGIMQNFQQGLANAFSSMKKSTSEVSGNAMKRTGNFITRALDKKLGKVLPQTADKIIKQFGLNNPGQTIANQAAQGLNTFWDKSKGTLKGIASKYFTGAKVGAIATAGVGIGLSYLSDLLDPSKWAQNPGGIFSGLKQSLKQVTGMFNQAPPEKKGFFQNMINKIKNALRQMASKFGLK